MSLLEVLCVASISAVLAGAAMPTATALVGLVATSSTSNELLADLFFARGEAIKRNRRVTMCVSADGRSCANAGGWDQGWIVFVDTDGTAAPHPGDTPLHARGALAGTLRVRGNATVARYVSYVPNGSTRLVGGGFQAGTVTVCPVSPGPVTARQVVINATGRPRVQKAAVDSCA